MFFVFLFFAASQRISVHFVYMHIGNGINYIVRAFAFSDGFKSKSAYNMLSALREIKLPGIVQSLQFSFTFDMHNIQEYRLVKVAWFPAAMNRKFTALRPNVIM